MANQLSADAKRVAGIIEEIEGYNHTISLLEYQICDVPQDQLEEDKEDLQDEQKRLQGIVNTMVNDLKFDDDCEIVYDDHLTQVKRNGVLWLECKWSGKDDSVSNWIEHKISAIGVSQLTLIREVGYDPDEEE